VAVSERSLPGLGELLILLRMKARLTQEELAERATLSPRTVSDLERGIHQTARKATAELLADALGLEGPVREQFFAAAQPRAAAGETPGVRTAGTGSLPPLEVRYSLPPDTAVFTGREAELGQIAAAVIDAAEPGRVVMIHAIDGMPGVGKTTLAVHAAHLLRERFADWQMFIDLHGHTPGQDPVSPAAALAGLLTATGIDPRQLPEDTAARAGLWRDRMAGQRALLVFDNAASSSQVAPLLPGGRDCLVLVTSRRHLGDLPGLIAPVRLEVLPPDQAQEMFVRLAPGTAPGEVVAELVRQAGFLPLAISLLARVYVRHPAWTMADLTAETKASMLTLAAETDSVAAVFEVSYRHLSSALQRFFRWLSLHPGTTIDPFAAAALADTTVAEAAEHLDTLHHEALLTEVGYRRYGMHDLIRRYAQQCAAGDPTAEREQALERLLDFYTCTAAEAEVRLARQTWPGPAQIPATPQTAMPDLSDSAQALSWARAERANLFACLDHVTGTSQHARVVALTGALATLLRQDGPWPVAILRNATAVDAAKLSGDRPGRAGALRNLGMMRRLSGNYPSAIQAQDEALALYRDLGDRLGQANALCELGTARRLSGDRPGAAQAQQEALALFRELGDWHGQANTLCELGAVRRLSGDLPSAAQAQEEALALFRDVGDRPGQANALNYLGAVHQMTGAYHDAVRSHEEALVISRELGHRHGQASALNFLGSARQLAGDYPGAAQSLEEALAISQELGHRHSQANALNELGILRRMTGDHPGAANALDEALDLYRGLGDQAGQLTTLNEMGALHRADGDLRPAAHCHQEALELARMTESAWEEARALAGLGHCALATGDVAIAQTFLKQAWEIFERIGAPEAAELAELTNQIATEQLAERPT
jgi:tetratricopeptide (TPR) repeat protein/transcriptional regulator with XRE-family HTH domain